MQVGDVDALRLERLFREVFLRRLTSETRKRLGRSAESSS